MTTTISNIMILDILRKKQGASRSIYDHSKVCLMTPRQHLSGPDSILVTSISRFFMILTKTSRGRNGSREVWNGMYTIVKIINKLGHSLLQMERGCEALSSNENTRNTPEIIIINAIEMDQDV